VVAVSVKAMAAVARGMVARTLLSDTCRLKATVETGLDAHTWPAATGIVPCAVQNPQGAGDIGAFDANPAARHKTILLPAGVAVSPSHRIEWVDGSGNTTYEVEAVEQSGSHDFVTVCQCVEVPA
jgi:hypothetical protein